MPRLNREEWALARAEYEARGASIRGVARLFGVDPMAVQRRAKAEEWDHGRGLRLVDDKVAALKALHRIETEKSTLTPAGQAVVDVEVDRRLAEEGLSLRLRCAVMAKGLEVLAQVTTPGEWSQMAAGTAKLTRPDVVKVMSNSDTGTVGPTTGLDFSLLSMDERRTLEALLIKASPGSGR